MWLIVWTATILGVAGQPTGILVYQGGGFENRAACETHLVAHQATFESFIRSGLLLRYEVHNDALSVVFTCGTEPPGQQESQQPRVEPINAELKTWGFGFEARRSNGRTILGFIPPQRFASEAACAANREEQLNVLKRTVFAILTMRGYAGVTSENITIKCIDLQMLLPSEEAHVHPPPDEPFVPALTRRLIPFSPLSTPSQIEQRGRRC